MEAIPALGGALLALWLIRMLEQGCPTLGNHVGVPQPIQAAPPGIRGAAAPYGATHWIPRPSGQVLLLRRRGPWFWRWWNTVGSLSGVERREF